MQKSSDSAPKSSTPSTKTRVEDATRVSVLEELEAERLNIELKLNREQMLQRCRDDINAFITYCFGIKQHAFHRKLQSLADTHQYLSLACPIEHGKTTNFSIARPLWLLGNQPHHTLAILGNATENPERCLGVIRTHIEQNPRVKEVFPDLELIEATKSQITVKRPPTLDKDPSIIAMGVGGSIIGRRWSGLILDDFIDFQNSWTHGERRKLWSLIESTVLGRVIQSGFIISIGTPWHLEDAFHKLQDLPEFTHYRFDATDMLWPEIYTDPLTGKEYGFTKKRLDGKRKSMSALEFDRQFRCLASTDSMRIFERDAIEMCKVPGKGKKLGRVAPEGSTIVTGVDAAIKKQDTADLTCFFTVAIKDGKKEVLDIQSGRWELSEIVRQAIAIVRKYPQHAGFRVETNAAMDYLRQTLENPDMLRALGATEADMQRIRVTPHQTTARKYDPVTGVRGMQVDFEQTRFIIPCDEHMVCEEETQAWIDELLKFDPLAHTGDRAMASWLATEEARRYSASSGTIWDSFGLI